jgi:pyruvate dehydrogenase E2 component (dihydrolipoamide acetyltransferase)
MSTDASAPTATGAKGVVVTTEPTRAQRTVARRMAESKATIPDFQASVEADVTELLAARGAVTVTAAVVHAAGLALREHPPVNGAYADGKYQHYERANVGVVVGGGEALVIPTIFDADAKSAATVSEQLAALVAEVRDGSITAATLSGATFTVSSLGMHGVGAFTAIIQPGQAATLAVGAAVERVALRDDGVAVARRVVTLTLSADQRIVSGMDAAAFLGRVRGLLEDPGVVLAG